MNKIILMVLLSVVSSSAMAEWVQISSSNKVAVYANLGTIRKTGDIVKIWRMYDLKSPLRVGKGKEYSSIKALVEYDCRNDKIRTLTMVNYAKIMGGGDVVNSDEIPSDWSEVVPDSVGEGEFEIICGKK